MHVTFRCPNCDQSRRSDDCRPGKSVRCECGWSKPVTEKDFEGNAPNHCLICGTLDLWRQKDFPPSLGLLCVATGAITSSIAWYYHQPIWAMGILMAFALLDMSLYVFMSDVLVCYRCRARHGKVDLTGREAYDHELGERYRQEEIRSQANSKS
ncbi:MAG: hypothetical protein U0929_17860 [Planctomycetaceae bacterium]